MTYSQPPGPHGQPQYPEGTGGQSPHWQPQAKGFIAALFDFSFDHFAAPSIIRILYVLGLIGITLGYLSYVTLAFTLSGLAGFVTLLFGLIVAFISLAFWRVTLEFYLAVIRMSEDIHRHGFPGGR